jgi:hypothetical protein
MAYDYYARAFMGENLDSMPDYATALKIYNARKPYIKGKYKGERPLGNNRNHCRSRIELDKDGIIRVKHWQTDIITYTPDGSITLQTGGWSSISTAQIMQELLGVDRICRVHCKIYYRHDDHFYVVGGNGWSGIHTDPNGHPINVNDEYVWVAKKEEMAKYRKKYDFFSEYAKQVLTMSSDFKVGIKSDKYAPDFEGETLKEWYMIPLINQNVRHDSKARDRARDALFDYLDSLSTKAEEDRLLPMYELLTPITYMMGSEFNRGWESITWSCNYTQLKRGFENLIKHHFASEIFTTKLASKKSPVRDPNAKYMRTN